MWNLKNDTKKLTYKTEKKLTDIESNLMVTKGSNEGAGEVI